MTELSVYQGASADFPLQAVKRGALADAVFAAGDPLTCYVYPGQSQAILFTPSVGWYTAAGTQTGYEQGEVLVSISNAQSALLEQNAIYQLRVEWAPAATPTKTSPICRTGLQCLPSAGAGVQTITPYCTYKDLLEHAPWVQIVQDQNTDQAGFYNQRLQAREWMDWAILNNYRGSYVGLFEEHSYAAFAFGYAGWRRSIGPSKALIDYLAAGKLMLRPQIVKCCAYKAISQVGLAQMGTNNQFASLGAYFEAQATREMIATTAEVDINDDNQAEYFINLGSTNTLFT